MGDKKKTHYMLESKLDEFKHLKQLLKDPDTLA